MPQKSPIEWTDYTSNPIYVTRKRDGKRGWHCDKPSPGCGHCYAETLNKRLGTGFDFIGKNAEKLDFNLSERELESIFNLNTRLEKKNQTAKLFLCDMTDLFLENHTDGMINRLFRTMALCPSITFQILTKRADRMREYMNTRAYHAYNDVRLATEVFPPPNIWLGVSVENQKTADERITHLLKTPAAVRWLSCEPLLEEVSLLKPHPALGIQTEELGKTFPDINWAVVGGESGNKARPTDIQWLRAIVDQCKSAKVPVFVKQLGSCAYFGNWSECGEISYDVIIDDFDHKGRSFIHTKNRKGGEIKEFPKDLQIREFPNQG